MSTETDEEYQAKVARIARDVATDELAMFDIVDVGAQPGGMVRFPMDGPVKAKLIAQIAEHIAAVVARETM